MMMVPLDFREDILGRRRVLGLVFGSEWRDEVLEDDGEAEEVWEGSVDGTVMLGTDIVVVVCGFVLL